MYVLFSLYFSKKWVKKQDLEVFNIDVGLFTFPVLVVYNK